MIEYQIKVNIKIVASFADDPYQQLDDLFRLHEGQRPPPFLRPDVGEERGENQVGY